VNRRRYLIAGSLATAIVIGVLLATTIDDGVFGLSARLRSRKQSNHSVGVPVPQLVVDPSSVADPLPQFVPTPLAWEPNRIEAVMSDWRGAINSKNAEAVERIDELFRVSPDAFRPALHLCALKDTEPRIRAFCTRVLGNARHVDSIPTMRLCLKDSGEYVRSNAAWALGQLKDEVSLPTLKKLAAHDSSPVVRAAASESLRQLMNIAAASHSP
jgi:hypothetical protein